MTGTCEPLRDEETEETEILYCLEDNCFQTKWDGSEGVWGVDSMRSQMIVEGHPSRFAPYCPMHQETRRTPRFDVG